MADSPLRMADRLFRLADRLADNPFSAISSSLYNIDNERRTAILEDMADFFTYLILYRYQVLFSNIDFNIILPILLSILALVEGIPVWRAIQITEFCHPK